jgi:hypothetical protein
VTERYLRVPLTGLRPSRRLPANRLRQDVSGPYAHRVVTGGHNLPQEAAAHLREVVIGAAGGSF